MYKMMERIMMKKWQICVLLAAFSGLFWGTPLFAQEGQRYGLPGESPGTVRKLSPNEAVELAIKNNLGLESERISAGTKKRASDFSWNQFIPATGVQGMVNRLNEEPNPLLGTQWSAQGQLSFELGLNLAMFEQIKGLRLDYENGLLSYEKAKAETEKVVRQTYYEVVYLREQIDILEDSFANIQRQAAMAEANYRAGLIPEVDFLRARVAVEIFKPNLDQAKNGLKTLMANFAFLLGLPTTSQFEFDDAPSEISYLHLNADELGSKAIAGNWDIVSLRKSILVTQSGKWAQFYSNYTPSLFFNWNFTRSLADPWKNEWFNSNNWVPGGSLTIGVRFYLDNLLPFGKGAQAVKNINDSIADLNVKLNQLTQKTAIDIYSTVLSLEQIRSQAEAQKLTMDLAERSYQLTEQAYRGGLKQLLDVQSAEQDLRQARLDMLRRNTDYLKGLLDLEYAIGVPFGTLGEKN
jgi:outer membrane protein TolC